MKASKSVKKHPLNKIFFLFLVSLSFQAKAALYPKLECGTYLIQGTIRKNAQGHPLIVVNDRTTSAREFILLGGSPIKKLNLMNQTIMAEVYLPHPIPSEKAPLVYLQAWQNDKQLEPIDFVRNKNLLACGDNNKLQFGTSRESSSSFKSPEGFKPPLHRPPRP